MNRYVFALFACALSAAAQTPAPTVGGIIHVSVAYPPQAILKARYSIKSAPKGLVWAEITARNQTAGQVDIGEGDVIQVCKAHGLIAFGSGDGAALMGSSQAHGAKAQWLAYTAAGLQIAAIVTLSGAVHISPGKQSQIGQGLSGAAAAASVVSNTIGAVPNSTYGSAGLQATEQIPAHQAMTQLVLMGVPAAGAVSEFDVEIR